MNITARVLAKLDLGLIKWDESYPNKHDKLLDEMRAGESYKDWLLVFMNRGKEPRVTRRDAADLKRRARALEAQEEAAEKQRMINTLERLRILGEEIVRETEEIRQRNRRLKSTDTTS